ncbi:MAG: SPOR domain-containing protein, partial [Prevotella sp.]|nr:SPOR domain-containing protein [Prevotella sp.]
TTGTPEQIATAAEEKPTEKQAEKEVVKTGPSFAIVLACQIGKKNAADFVERLHQKGFDEARVLEYGKDIRVVYGNFSSETEAYNALRPLRQTNSDFADGWVMKTAE